MSNVTSETLRVPPVAEILREVCSVLVSQAAALKESFPFPVNAIVGVVTLPKPLPVPILIHALAS
ncbi:hypothetical protein [Riemerella anatipestifer]|uniref:hypothetical protein n=1 Tax=Riemerella anatipestifer TaxID=34085 RepID=UPI000A3E14B0|nr:hypothetical protein [Riemerella anatipestifer]MCO7315928.1 hypothetical protein [Riemerella anatipestifer]MCO7323903.1 hypothetical protein [Riemerella anatipestifer]MCQ4036790.1 hypothetical protein [Riemerella anatipestifer]MCQ4062833.1 hypothetical protein [Riemerella anatipestifer]MCQ4156700.1 hypothetical protein [Riemerella anatipestifer]